MAVIYDNKVKGMGDCVAEFEDSGMFILFGDNAPDTLKDYCYSIDVNPIAEEIKAGQKAVIDGIQCVGCGVCSQLCPKDAIEWKEA